MSYNNDSVSLPSQSNKLHAPGSVSEITRISLPVLNLAYNLNNALKSTIEEIKKVNSSVPIELEVFYSPLVLSLLRPQKLQTRREKRNQLKTARIETISLPHLCPVSCPNYLALRGKNSSLRENLPKNHALFLAYLSQPKKIKSASSKTNTNIVKKHVKDAGIDTTTYGPHSIRSASSTKTFQLGTHIQQIKQHAHWSFEVNTFEIFYLKPLHQETTSTAINESIVSSATKNNTTSPVRLESTKLFLDL
ncbi:hypothetical protein G6F57_011897 [Rhizopus arrhizus]|nr:hypothetical protein G6F24_011639 [Rhizopus arrhizus]KAG1405735.1 hypothetical protein G6F58_009964 [Rhizopus delemar]KAG0930284.1 hypothetical protein G6F30_011683 [Rhizopus arrhizus]KAG0977389.1 hypothetical protein G6F29_010102 [Rhizopus arrhizus]KAG0990972.1 hypothetical protein G6F28_009030 [Rhizopus arrhizus]